MWLLFAFLSAGLLGFYDVFKKRSLNSNAVLPVLFINTVICAAIFMPFVFLSSATSMLDGSDFYVPDSGWEGQKYIILKSIIVLLSWIFGYYAMKHLPITIVGPINATRPVLVLIGAVVVYGERLNIYQWIGIVLAMASFVLLNRSSRKEGIDFKHDRWIYFLVLAAVMGAISGLYDKYLMASYVDGGLGLPRMAVQSWYNVYQSVMMGIVMLVVWLPKRRVSTPFKWRWSIVLISVFLSAADFLYFYSLSLPDAMISVVSMVRRGSVIVSFLFGALIFHEKNLKGKAIDLLLVLLGMLFLYIGSR